jgi:hypothetical protein
MIVTQGTGVFCFQTIVCDRLIWTFEMEIHVRLWIVTVGCFELVTVLVLGEIEYEGIAVLSRSASEVRCFAETGSVRVDRERFTTLGSLIAVSSQDLPPLLKINTIGFADRWFTNAYISKDRIRSWVAGYILVVCIRICHDRYAL